MEVANLINPYVFKAGTHPGRLFVGQPDEISLSLAELCSKHQSFCLEIGSGSGAHIISRAAANPSIGYLGIELRFKRAVRTIEKAKFQNIDNLYIVRENINNIWDGLSKIQFDSVFVNFPDPWPRKKSWKHRLLSVQQLRNLSEILKPNAYLEFRSDHREYFEWVTQQMELFGLFEIESETDDFFSQTDWQTWPYRSEFEEMFYYQNLKINYLKARFLGGASQSFLVANSKKLEQGKLL